MRAGGASDAEACDAIGWRGVTQLRGLTPARTHDALVACSALWRAKTGVAIVWEQGTAPVEDRVGRYDLVVIDHPALGQLVDRESLLPLNGPARVADIVRLAGQAVGESFNAYRWQGDQWALPIAAAAQVQAWRADRMESPVRAWDDLLPLAAQGRVLLALKPPDALLLFFALCANLGEPCGAIGRDALIDGDFGADVLSRVRALVKRVDPACCAMDADAVLARLARPEAAEHCAPYVFGDVRYARAGTLRFADIPATGEGGPVGAVLGGAGIAVSASSAAAEAASAFAFWVASAAVQRGPYADAGGQPANAVAWHDGAVNDAAGGLLRDTWTTLDGAWMRPRHDGYLAFQAQAAERLTAALGTHEDAAAVIADLNRMYAASFG